MNDAAVDAYDSVDIVSDASSFITDVNAKNVYTHALALGEDGALFGLYARSKIPSNRNLPATGKTRLSKDEQNAEICLSTTDRGGSWHAL